MGSIEVVGGRVASRAHARDETVASDVTGLVLGQPVVERLQAHAEHLGAAPLVAVAQVERRVDRLTLDLRERGADRDAQAFADRLRARQPREVELDDVVGQDERALHGILAARARCPASGARGW